MSCRHILYLLVALPLAADSLAGADDVVTREYRLKHADSANVIQVINFCVKNSTQKRIIGGQDRRLVVTDAMEHQTHIAQLLPILDQPTQTTDPRKIQMEMMVRASRFLQERKKSYDSPPAAQPKMAVSASAPAMKVVSSDKAKAPAPYKSIYSDEDAKLGRTRFIQSEPVVGSLTSLTLKGIYQEHTQAPLALLNYEGKNYMARDGGLYEGNRDRVKGVASEVFKDRVILTGPDRIPREILFRTTL